MRSNIFANNPCPDCRKLSIKLWYASEPRVFIASIISSIVDGFVKS